MSRQKITICILLFVLYAIPSFAEGSKSNLLHLLKGEVDLLKATHSCAPTMIIGGSGKRKHICVNKSGKARLFAESNKGRLVSLTETEESFELDLETFLVKLELPQLCSKKTSNKNSSVYECLDNEFVIVNFVENEFLFKAEYCLLNFCKSDLNF